ncbi:hypothetical protein K493DRAFT_315881 [Basidiobolus meristosporus CBS 931.73]|uniref:Uncharacterized protein n=1 Tax=Basidiobolus meristosporus CBS 931.73 TaxID=1314790 RepID=A0A1Y1Y6R9_9FUNG|nr:hypothetical protein K493DRAFT_315881 [Basidiobolus meristosporus CBS 931.73]|eukprot:ORX93659.1 hypothetical protein K493DRAFT_315881 [Basidiobolus meristosporus CBS 931.73]
MAREAQQRPTSQRAKTYAVMLTHPWISIVHRWWASKALPLAPTPALTLILSNIPTFTHTHTHTHTAIPTRIQRTISQPAPISAQTQTHTQAQPPAQPEP